MVLILRTLLIRKAPSLNYKLNTASDIIKKELPSVLSEHTVPFVKAPISPQHYKSGPFSQVLIFEEAKREDLTKEVE